MHVTPYSLTKIFILHGKIAGTQEYSSLYSGMGELLVSSGYSNGF